LLANASGGLPLDQNRVDARELLAADAKSVQRAFSNYIHPDHFVRVVEGP